MAAIQEKPARLQVDPDTIADDDKPPQSGTTFNIWFLKWSGGGDSSSKRNFVKLKFRVDIKRDSGYSKSKPNSPVCIFFAQGCCYLGKKCPYKHRLPQETDFFLPTQDCFGRDRTSDYRDDMDGVGSFKPNRTLYVGGLHMNDKIENSLTKHFLEFGSIEKIRVLYGKSCAFVTFRLESEAQFAKEAMQSQSLGGDDILTIRWASEDPNPAAQKEEQQRREEIAYNTVKKLLGLIQEPRKKKQKVVVEEPEEPESIPDQQEVKSIEPTPTGINFNQSSLQTLARIRQQRKEKVPVAAQQPQTVTSLIGAYSSDSDEE